MGYEFVDDLLRLTTPEKPEVVKRKNIGHRRTTLHRRDVEHMDFYVVARFIHALIKVRVEVKVDEKTSLRIPQVLEVGVVEMCLPVWHKTGEGWQFSEYKTFAREGLGLTVAMMRAIVNYLGIRESAIVNALQSLSMISSSIGPDGEKRQYRQMCIGNLINPSDGQRLSFPEMELEGFILDRKRVQEWIDKDLQKRGKLSN
jgi:hypothetical protein